MRGITQIQGVKVGFQGKLVGQNVVRVSSVFEIK
jgi:hypothetical protein